MKIFTIPTGQTVVYFPKDTVSVAVEIAINVGSFNERKNNAGVAHFIEHMLFEGTKKRKDSLAISNEIEKLGGELNAYTLGCRTAFYGKVPSRHAHKLIEVLFDMLTDPLFDCEKIKKEKSVVINEILGLHDDPRLYQWIMLSKALYTDHPFGREITGTKKTVASLRKEDILSFFNRYYTAKNTIISIVGKVPNLNLLLTQPKGKKNPSFSAVKDLKENKIIRQKRKVESTYSVIGFRGAVRLHPDSYVLDVINAILGRGQSGRMFDIVRAKAGLAYEVGTINITEKDYGNFNVYAAVKDLKKAKKLVFDTLRMENLTDKDINDAKRYIEGNFVLENEDTMKLADTLAFWQSLGSAALYKEYLKKIKRVTKKDVMRVSRKIFRKPYTMAVIYP